MNLQSNMNRIQKVLYVVVALSFLPLMITFFGWGNSQEMIFLILYLFETFALIYLVFNNTTFITVSALIVGSIILIEQIIGLKTFYFNSGDGDILTTLLFTLQPILLLASLINIYTKKRKIKG